MTLKEAKIFLLQLHTDKQLNKSEHEALRLAIKALEQEPVIDKIRAEIEELKNAPPCFDDMFEYKYAVDECLEIIDKYKAESEVQE